jgi:hypothetical protein
MDNNTEPQGRINPTNSFPPNPAKFFASWSSTKECFEIYNKETKLKELIPLPFIFLPLERCICLKGYNEPDKVSYISNEIKDLKNGIFTVKGYNGITKKSSVVLTGTWEAIKKDAKAIGADWTESIYIAVKNKEGKLELANVQLNGSGITHWFEFLKAVDVWTHAVCVKEFSKEQKGINKYNAPLFSAMKIKKETDIEAAALQKQIMAYLSEYFVRDYDSPTGTKTEVVNEQKSHPKDIDVPFDDTKHSAAQHSIKTEGPGIIYGSDDVPEF